ncbi:hypothetical protein [Pseudomonas sp. NBRC 111124]|uniref:hypothetical protein n=1 Tax=Pseudomonas sp. NBRC 111124 TaxID=1661039 RepID=UPI000761DA7B|nr:hypothetical protein [Pseudomonas sp. NBRC 111124]
MLFKLPTLVLGLALGATAQAAPSAETEAVYQRAMQMAQANEHWLDRLVEQEKNGQLDKQIMIEAAADLEGKLAAFEAELHKASDGGHAVATYLLGNMEERRKTLQSGHYEAKHAQACALYQLAADQGLLAGAVAVLRDCDRASMRFQFDDPQLLRMREQLQAALDKPDPFAREYPLPALNSFCFKPFKRPELHTQRPLGALTESMAPVLLELDQYRADAHYLLAVKGDPKTSMLREHYKKMLALTGDCLDPLGLAYADEVERKKAAQH